MQYVVTYSTNLIKQFALYSAEAYLEHINHLRWRFLSGNS